MEDSQTSEGVNFEVAAEIVYLMFSEKTSAGYYFDIIRPDGKHSDRTVTIKSNLPVAMKSPRRGMIYTAERREDRKLYVENSNCLGPFDHVFKNADQNMIDYFRRLCLKDELEKNRDSMHKLYDANGMNTHIKEIARICRMIPRADKAKIVAGVVEMLMKEML